MPLNTKVLNETYEQLILNKRVYLPNILAYVDNMVFNKDFLIF